MTEEIIYWGKRLYDKGMSPATTGNISKLDGNNILITASCSASADLTQKDIIKIDFEGNVVSGDKKPSSEKFLHIKIYQKRPDIKAIIHSHSPELTAFAVSGKEINEAIIPELPVYFKKVPICEYYMPSTLELANSAAEFFEQGYNAVLMKNHGVVFGAKDLKTCFQLAETLQMYVKIYFYSKILGNMNILNETELSALRQIKR